MRILFLGDSTMQFNDYRTYPQTGWVQMLDRFFVLGTEFVDFARNGRSSKSFIDEGRFDQVMANVRTGDFAFIQFGHNDEKKQDPARYTNCAEGGEFRKNLEYFIINFRGVGAYPILFTPVARREFSEDGKLRNTHGDYPEAIKETAKKLDIPCIDMTSLSTALIENAGIEGSKRFFMNFPGGIYENYPDGKSDNSHLRPDGAFELCNLVCREFYSVARKYPKYTSLVDSLIYNNQFENGMEIDDEHLMWKNSDTIL